MRKPITREAIAADIAKRGWACRSLSPAEYERLEQHYDVSEIIDARGEVLQNGRRVCRIVTKRN